MLVIPLENIISVIFEMSAELLIAKRNELNRYV
jgi:hypothetical protein